MCVNCDENSSTLPKGEKGDAGLPGSNGTNGTNFLAGTGAPSGGTGANGEVYLDLASFNLYSKAGGTWSLIGNIKGLNGSGLIKLAFTKQHNSISAGTAIEVISGSVFLAAYGIPTVSTPGGATPPSGYTYGTAKPDFLIQVYELNPSTNTWLRIPDIRVNIIVDNSSGDITVTTTGHTSSNVDVRYIIIG